MKFQKIETDVKNFKHAYHLCIIKLDNYKNNKNLRDQLAVYLKNNKIGVGITYRSVTDMTIFKKMFKWNKSMCPLSKNLGDNLISLPIYPDLKDYEQKYICEKIKKFFREKNYI